MGDSIRFRRTVRLALVLVCAVLSALASVSGRASPAAPTGHYVFKSYGASLGLANIGVNEIEEDAAGFIWVGTDDGLYRYDGYRFDAFGLRQGLPSTEVMSLNEDSRGVLWAGTRAGLARWNGHAFDAVALAGAPEGAPVVDVVQGPGGMWVASPAGLFLGEGATLQRAPSWPGGEATAIYKEPRSPRLWVGQWDGDAHLQAFDAGQWRRFDGPEGHPKERIDAIAQDGDGRLWVRTARNLWMKAPETDTFTLVTTPFPLDAQRGYIATDKRGALWVSTDHGLYRRDGEHWIDYGVSEGNRALIEDREGSIWFGLQGLHRLLGRGVLHSYSEREGLPGVVVWSVMRGQDGRLWVGTDAGLAWADGERFVTVPGTERNLIRSIVQAPDGALYLTGVPGNDLLRYDPTTGVLTHQEIWPANPIKRTFRLFRDRSNAYWAATEGAGLFRAEPNGSVLSFAPVVLPDGMPHEDIIDVRQDAAGRIWVAGQSGLAMQENGAWHRFNTHDGLRRDYLAYLRPLADGSLLVAYRDPIGVDRVRYAGGMIEIVAHYDSASSHSADKVFMVGEDAHGRIWIGGGEGLDLLQAHGTKHFGAAEGLAGEDISNQAFFADDNGDVWIGTSRGLARFDAAAYERTASAAPPAVTFITLRLGATTLSPDAPDVQVPHAQNTFEAHFSALDFASEGLIRYRQRLVGRESDFNVTELRDARYSALDPGAYSFEVAARVGDYGEWGPTATFGFSVQPAWWQTWWFRLLVALAAIGVVLLGLGWRLAALRRRNLWLEGIVAQRTLEVRQANEHLHLRNDELVALNIKLAGTQSQLLQSEKMASVGQLAAGVAHEINNPIAFVASNLRQLKAYAADLFRLLTAYEDIERECREPSVARVRALKRSVGLDLLREDTPQLVDESLSGIDRIEKIVKDLREFAHPGEPEWQSVDIEQGIDSTLNVAAHQIRTKADVVKRYGTIPTIEGVPSQLNQVFLNLLVNAAQAIEGRGTITIETGATPDDVWIAVSDTGCGIDAASLHRIFDPFYTTKPIGVGPGLGLSVSYGIVKEHGGRIDVESAPGQGAKFTVWLPRRRAGAAG